jgi:4-hydroxy-tetrahydrodipicolinate synthase
LDCVLEANQDLLPVVLGIGGNNTSAVVKELESTDLNGINGILSVSPYYNKPTQEGIFQHYKAINESTDRPIILYNVPARTGSNVLPQTVVRIANECRNVSAVKEASANIEQSMEIIRDKPEEFVVLSGDDALTLPLIACGAEGVISVVANAFPFEFSNMVRDCIASKFEKAKDNHYALLEIIKYLFTDGNPGGVKAALKILGVTGDDMRLPLVNVSDATYKKLDELISKLPPRE